MAESPKTVGIVGLGLIGGSIGLALRDPGRRILGFDPSAEAQELAQSRFCVDACVPFDEVAKADLVFVAAPPLALVPVLNDLHDVRGEATLVTDCGSVKAEVVAWALKRKADYFVPGHPMAGHEKSSAAYASAWMFRNARWLLCPTKATKTSAVRAVERVLAAMGATPVRIAPDDHDRQVAILSHLPHVFAATLVLLAEGLERTDISGGSWKDLTRVGGVDPQLWTQILSCNRAELVSTVAEAEDLLRQFRVALEGGDVDTIHDLLSRARAAKARQERA